MASSAAPRTRYTRSVAGLAATDSMSCATCSKGQGDLPEGQALLRCAGCTSAKYCSVEHQKANWNIHKAACLAYRTQRPYVVHFDVERDTIDRSPWSKPLIDSLAIPLGKTLFTAESHLDLHAVLRHPIIPAGILSTCGDLGRRELVDLQRALREYAESGGRFVIGGPGINYMSFGDIDELFADLGLPWKMLAYHRTTHSLNLAHPLYTALAADAPARMGLPQSYSAKCILLKNVAAKDVLYASTEKSGVESLAMAIRRGQVAKAEVATAAAQVGDGWISWVGDVNSEAGSTQTILFLLGL